MRMPTRLHFGEGRVGGEAIDRCTRFDPSGWGRGGNLRRNADGARDGSHLSFRDWAVGEFDTLTGPVKGANATAEVLLPIAAVAVGMTVLGLVFHIIASGAA